MSDGFVLSDWGAVHSTVPSALAGLDVEMPQAKYFGAALADAIANGTVPLAVLDDKVRRILTQMIKIGQFDAGRGRALDAGGPTDHRLPSGSSDSAEPQVCRPEWNLAVWSGPQVDRGLWS